MTQSISRRDQQQKDLNAILSSPLGAKNPIFSLDMIADLHAMFSLYADPRQKRADIRDILLTAKTLGLDKKFQLVFKALQEICQSVNADALDFESFLKELTNKIGNPYTQQARRANFKLLDSQGKEELDINDMKYINDQLKYGYTEQELEELIKSVGGFGSDTISVDRYSKIIEKRVKARKAGI